MVHMCKKIISPKVFFHFLKILIYWVNYFISVVKRAKNGPKWQKKISVPLHISESIHHYDHDSWFKKLQFCGLLGVKKAQNGTKWLKLLSFSLCVSRSVPHIIVVLHMCKMVLPACFFFIFVKSWFICFFCF